jgi:hypothetical protein
MSKAYYTADNWNIPLNVETLSLSFIGLHKVPENLKDATSIKELLLTGNTITVLENLPPNLETLICNLNKIHTINNLPKSLKRLVINYNQLKTLDNLPSNLEYLDCADNKLEMIQSFPLNLKDLNCSCNCLKNLPNLPKNLKKLYVEYNYLTSLPPLNEGLITVSYHNNSIGLLNYVPYSLETIFNDTQKPNKFIFSYLETLRSTAEKQRCMNRTRKIKEELMMKVWHPDNLEKWLAQEFDND